METRRALWLLLLLNVLITRNMESVIKWQTGNPRKEGEYIVSLFDGRVMIDELYSYEYIEGSSSTIEYAWRCNFFDAVIAWCKLSDIKPYKEEIK